MRDEEQNWVYKVLINDEGQYSLWPDFKEIPDGWRSAGFTGSKTEGSDFIDANWTDMRPSSLKNAMESDFLESPGIMVVRPANNSGTYASIITTFVAATALILSTIGVAYGQKTRKQIECSGGLGGLTERQKIIWDTYGVPHIYGPSVETVLRGYGYSQMNNHAELILKNIAGARGRMAEYWGTGQDDVNLTNDIQVRTLGIPGRASNWLRKSSEKQKRYLTSFVAGLNEYANKNPTEIDPSLRRVLPLNSEDIFSLLQRIVQFQNFGFLSRVRAWQTDKLDRSEIDNMDAVGSNAWALAPTKASQGSAILVGNPHWPWSPGMSANGTNFFQWFEAQLVVGDPCNPQLSATGATLVGLPFIVIGFNDWLGWSLTANSILNTDLYELKVSEDDDYEWDGGTRKLELRSESILVRQEDGTFVSRPINIYASRHGPVLARRSTRALAIRPAGLHALSLVSQFWDMIQARDLSTFNRAVSRQQLPRYSIVFADAHGDIEYIHNGLQPIRHTSDYQAWMKILPGDTSRLLWTKTLPWKYLPKVINPPSGFVQNANDPPWTSTFPPLLKRGDFPNYLAPDTTKLRPQAIARALTAKAKLGLEDVLALKESTTMLLADRVLPDLIQAIRASDHPMAGEIADVLSKWDRTSDDKSRGAALFERWLDLYTADPTTPRSLVFGKSYPRFRVEWLPARPLITPDGLAEPSAALPSLIEAARMLLEEFGQIDVTWGDVHRAVLSTHDRAFSHTIPLLSTPVSGSGDVFGTVRVLESTTNRELPKERLVTSGDSYVQIVEFRPNGPNAQTLIGYGNASRHNSPHVLDQLPFFSAKKLRPAWRSRSDVQAHAITTEKY